MSSANVSQTKNIPNMSSIPPHVLDIIREYVVGVYHSDDYDVRKPHFRQSVKDIYAYIIFLYVLLVMFGILANLAVLAHIIKFRLYKDPTYAFVINNVLSDIIKCTVVLPLTLHVLLIQNWVLGELLCSFLPMLQDIPVHVTTLTFMLMAWDRYRMIKNPDKPRLPSFVCVVGTWLTALCLVLPFPIYIIYVDLGKFASSLHDVGFCVINLIDDMQEYMRGIFLIMYAAPMAIISYLFVKTSRELQTNMTIIMFEARHRSSRSRTDSHSTTTEFQGSRGDGDLLSQYSRGSYRESGCRIRQEADPELDVIKEKRTQKYLALMITVYAVCLCPLMVLRVVRLVLLETYENTAHLDLTYTTFVWIGFLPTCTTPVLYATWQMSRSAKERLRGYFRFSNRKLRQSCETVLQSTASNANGAEGSPKIVHIDDIHQRELHQQQQQQHQQQQYKKSQKITTADHQHRNLS